MNPRQVKKTIIAGVTFLGGLYFFLEFFLPETLDLNFIGLDQKIKFGKYHQEISKATILIGVMAIGLGLINLVRVHGTNILKGKKGKINSYALLIGLFGTLFIEAFDFKNTEQKLSDWQRIDAIKLLIEKDYSKENRALAKNEILKTNKEIDNKASFLFPTNKEAEEKTTSLKTELNQSTELLASSNQESKNAVIDKLKISTSLAREITDINYNNTTAKKAATFVFESFFVPLGSAMFSLLAFYVATAAYRTFRIKSLEALCMMTAALLVMLGQIPIGYIYISEDLPSIRFWLIQNISTPAFRAIYLGSSIAGLAMALRMWLSIEKSPLSSEE